MIPYFSMSQVMLGPVPVQVWGSFVALGVLIGAWQSARFAKRQGLDPEIIWRGAAWIIIAAFVGARLVHVLAYQPDFYLHQPFEIIKVWHGGYSIMGGFLGAMVGYALFLRRYRLDWLKYLDAFIYGLPLGMACGRIGCFLIHDHPGTLTNFVLGVRDADGQTRHDLGLYESLHSLALAVLFMVLAQQAKPSKPRAPGFYARVFLIWYGLIRFSLDFLRVGDKTYAGLTPAQYACVAMFGVGIFWALRLRKR